MRGARPVPRGADRQGRGRQRAADELARRSAALRKRFGRIKSDLKRWLEPRLRDP